MSLSISDSLRDGFDRATNRNAGLLFVVFFIYSLVDGVVANSSLAAWNAFMHELLPSLSEQSTSAMSGGITSSHPLVVPMPLGAALVFVVGVWITGEAVRVVSDRTFISEETERLHEPTRWLGWATLSSFCFTFLFTMMLVICLFFLSGVIGISSAIGWPGALVGLFVVVAVAVGWIVLSVMFFLTRQEIATKDVGPFEAVSGSWSLVRDNEWSVFGLGVVLYLPGVIINRMELVLPDLLGHVPTTLITTVVSPVYLVFAGAIVAQAYRQLRAENRDDEIAERSTSSDEWNEPSL